MPVLFPWVSGTLYCPSLAEDTDKSDILPGHDKRTLHKSSVIRNVRTVAVQQL